MKHLSKTCILSALLSTTLMFSPYASANISFKCQSLQNTNWYGNVSSDNGRISKKVDIEISNLVREFPDEEHYQLVGTMNGKPLTLDSSVCIEYENGDVFVAFETEGDLDVSTNHPLPSQMPISGVLRTIDGGHVDGMLMKV